MSIPTHTVLSVQQFLTKNGMTPMPHSPYSPKLALSDIFRVSPDEKSPQGERVSRCGRDDKKMAEALKGIKINKFKNYFEQCKKHLDTH